MSIQLAKHIHAILSASSNITAVVADRIYKSGINADVPFPFIVYNYVVNSVEGTKDGDGQDDCDIEVYVFSQDGAQELELSEKVRNALAHTAGNYGSFEVDDIDFISYEDSLEEGVYVGILRFNCKTY